MTSSEIRSRFLKFFEKRGHAIIPSASLVTSDEKGITNPTLFNTAGMQPLIPYLLGKPYVLPDGKEVKRLADAQKCLRTIDIDDVGDKTHATFFEMLGNWSLGDYFKEDAIKWSYEFLTSKEEGLGLDPKRLYVTVFAGDRNAEKDSASAAIWESLGIPNNRIYFKGAESNWWPAVKGKDDWTGPTGPCSEMFYDITPEGLGDLSPEGFKMADEEQKAVEIWNDVFMEFEKVEGKITGKLAKKNVDTGAGLERLATVLQKVDNIYDTDLLKPVLDIIKKSSKSFDLVSARIVADHLRAATFLTADGVIPGNTDRGYVLRKLIRRAVFKMKSLDLDEAVGTRIIERYAEQYSGVYGNLDGQAVGETFREEEQKFKKTLMEGKKEFENGVDAFTLFSSYGFPLELTLELAKEKGIKVDTKDFDEKFKAHQALSRSGAEQKFKGGLADANDPMVVRYHTATHLLHQALHDVLGDDIMQKGSNITTERLRFDFTHGAKMTDEEKKRVEDIVNRKIAEKLPMNRIVMPRAEAEKTGARHFFGEKYGDEISIYFLGPASDPPTAADLKNAYSKEFCGGPHVKNAYELAGPEGKWRFKIQKEEAVAQGVRRIKALLG